MFNSDLMRNPAFIGYAHECDEHERQMSSLITMLNNGEDLEDAMCKAGLTKDDLCPLDYRRIRSEVSPYII